MNGPAHHGSRAQDPRGQSRGSTGLMKWRILCHSRAECEMCNGEEGRELQERATLRISGPESLPRDPRPVLFARDSQSEERERETRAVMTAKSSLHGANSASSVSGKCNTERDHRARQTPNSSFTFHLLSNLKFLFCRPVAVVQSAQYIKQRGGDARDNYGCSLARITLSLSLSPSSLFSICMPTSPVFHYIYTKMGSFVIIFSTLFTSAFLFQDHLLNHHKIQANYVNINIREINYSDISATTSHHYISNERTSSDEPSSLPEREKEKDIILQNRGDI